MRCRRLPPYEMRSKFDYITLLLGSDFEEFPTSYNGVSGGGIWYQRFITKDGKVYTVEPFLAGIAVWESELTNKQGWKVRRITGHGFASIYGHAKRALYDKKYGVTGS